MASLKVSCNTTSQTSNPQAVSQAQTNMIKKTKIQARSLKDTKYNDP